MVLNRFFYFKLFLLLKIYFYSKLIFGVTGTYINILRLNLIRKASAFKFFKYCNLLQVFGLTKLYKIFKVLFTLSLEIFINLIKIKNKNSLRKFNSFIIWCNKKNNVNTGLNIMPCWIKIKYVDGGLILKMSFQGFSKVISFSFSFNLIVTILLFKFIYLFKNFFILTVFKYNFLLLFF